MSAKLLVTNGRTRYRN